MKGGEGSPFLVMPELGAEEYIVGLWAEAGTIEQTGQGITRLSWQEIESWMHVRQLKGEVPLTAWEIDTIRRMSEEYSHEYSLASTKGHPAPYAVYSEEDFDRGAMGNKVANVLAGFKTVRDEPRYTVEE